MHRDFSDDAAINLLSDEQREDLDSDKLWLGLYVAKPETDHSVTKHEFLSNRDKELKILVLLCKSEDDRRAVITSGFVVCGDNLCWKYPDRKVINILNLALFNQERKVEEEKDINQLIIDDEEETGVTQLIEDQDALCD